MYALINIFDISASLIKSLFAFIISKFPCVFLSSISDLLFLFITKGFFNQLIIYNGRIVICYWLKMYLSVNQNIFYGNILHHIFFWTGSQLEDFHKYQGAFVYTRLHPGYICVYTIAPGVYSCIAYYDIDLFSVTKVYVD